MRFTFLLLSPYFDRLWPEKMSRTVPGTLAKGCTHPEDALAHIETANVACGPCRPNCSPAAGGGVSALLPGAYT